MKHLKTIFSFIKVMFLAGAVIPVLLFAVNTVSAAVYTDCSSLTAVNKVITISENTVFKATSENNGVFDCGDNSLVVDDNVTLTLKSHIGPDDTVTDDDFGVTIKTTGTITVTELGVIEADGQGYSSDQGPGKGLLTDSSTGGGASYGSNGNGKSNGPYGVSLEPKFLGSGGASVSVASGGAGGGAIILLADNLILEGKITAKGANGDEQIIGERNPKTYLGGGGSGGSIYVEVNSLEGAGFVDVLGGAGGGSAGNAGSGGRAAIVYKDSSFSMPESSEAKAGSVCFLKKEAGEKSLSSFSVCRLTDGDFDENVLYFKDINVLKGGTLWIENGSERKNFILSGNLNLEGSSQLAQSTSVRWEIGGDVKLNSSHLFAIGDGIALYMSVWGSVDLSAGSSFQWSGAGFPSNSGPGKGNSGASFGSGAGHGGLGGKSLILSGGSIYGDELNPLTFGSGGGFGGVAKGGDGGGLISLYVNNNFKLTGNIYVNGDEGTELEGSGGGGGSGGSVLLKVNKKFEGGGKIFANGANAKSVSAGAGGGGRIAVYYGESEFSGNLTAAAGSGGYASAEDGTVNVEKSEVPISSSISLDQGDIGKEVDKNNFLKALITGQTSSDEGNSVVGVNFDNPKGLSEASLAGIKLFPEEIDLSKNVTERVYALSGLAYAGNEELSFSCEDDDVCGDSDYGVKAKIIADYQIGGEYKAALEGLARLNDNGWVQFDWSCGELGLSDELCEIRHPHIYKSKPFEWRIFGYAWMIMEQKWLNLNGLKVDAWGLDFPVNNLSIKFADMEVLAGEGNERLAVAGVPGSGYVFDYSMFGALSDRPLVSKFLEAVDDPFLRFYDVIAQIELANSSLPVYFDRRNKIKEGAVYFNTANVDDSWNRVVNESYWSQGIYSHAPTNGDMKIFRVTVKLKRKGGDREFWLGKALSSDLTWESGIKGGVVYFAKPLWGGFTTEGGEMVFDAVIGQPKTFKLWSEKGFEQVDSRFLENPLKIELNLFPNETVEVADPEAPKVRFVFDQDRVLSLMDGVYSYLLDSSKKEFYYFPEEELVSASVDSPLMIAAAPVFDPNDSSGDIFKLVLAALADVVYENDNGDEIRYPLASLSSKAEDCSNWIDDDLDGFVDGQDSQCGGDQYGDDGGGGGGGVTCDELTCYFFDGGINIEVQGVVSMKEGVRGSLGQQIFSVGDNSVLALRDKVYASVAKWLSGANERLKVGTEVEISSNPGKTDWKDNFTADAEVKGQDGNVKLYYFKDKDVVFDGDITAFLSDRTVVAECGDVYIKGNLYDAGGHALGIIAFACDGKGGNIYVSADATYVKANIFADGSMFPYNPELDERNLSPIVGSSGVEACVNGDGEFSNVQQVCIPVLAIEETVCAVGTGDSSAGVNRSAEPCFPYENDKGYSRTAVLRNQLCLEGSFSVNNTLGGGDEFMFPNGYVSTSDEERWRSKYYDLAEARKFTRVLEKCEIEGEDGVVLGGSCVVLDEFDSVNVDQKTDLTISDEVKVCEKWILDNSAVMNQVEAKTWVLDNKKHKAVYIFYNAPKGLPGFDFVGEGAAAGY